MTLELKHLVLSRPLCVVDLETTGVDPAVDRVVEVAVLKLAPGGAADLFHSRVNPGRPVPPAATAVHGIADIDVRAAPTFAALAPALARRLAGCDLAGFGVAGFDLPLLCAEFARAGVPFTVAGRAVLDALAVYRRYEARTLAAAVGFYLGRAHHDARAAAADAAAAAEVLDAQVGRYGLPAAPADLHAPLVEVDVAGKFRRGPGGAVVFAFGKHVGRPLAEVVSFDLGYLQWMLTRPFLDDAHALVRAAVAAARRPGCHRHARRPAGRLSGRPACVSAVAPVPSPTPRSPPMKPAHAALDPVREKFARARNDLCSPPIERDEEVDLVLTALVAHEHVLLVGPPGCGKSLLLDSLLAWTGGTKFAVLLTKFTTPEEDFGPVSLAGLKEDRYVRVTAGRLPEADFAFVDEVWKASSAVLNTLLKVLNERTYDAGDGVARRVPLRLCVAASNEWPAPDTGKELAALLDRFLLRTTVAPVRSQAGRQRLLWTRDHAPRLSTAATPAEVEHARRRALAMPWSREAKEALEVVIRDLAREGVRGAGVRLPVRGRRSTARAPGGRPAHPLGRPAGAAAGGRPGDRPGRQPGRDAGHATAARGRGGAGRGRRAEPGRRRPGRGQARRGREATRRAQGERPGRSRPSVREGSGPEAQARFDRGRLTPSRARPEARTCEPFGRTGRCDSPHVSSRVHVIPPTGRRPRRPVTDSNPRRAWTRTTCAN